MYFLVLLTQLQSVFFCMHPPRDQWPPNFRTLGCFSGWSSLAFPRHSSLPIAPRSTRPPAPRLCPYHPTPSGPVQSPWLASHRALRSCHPAGTGGVRVDCGRSLLGRPSDLETSAQTSWARRRMPQAGCLRFAEWLDKWLDILEKILKDNRKCFFFMVRNLLHVLSSWLLFPQHTFEKINQVKCSPHIFPPPSFFFCFETATALFHVCSTGNVLSLGQGREKSKLAKKQPCSLLAQGWEARLALPPLHLELSSPSLPPFSQPPGVVGPSLPWGTPGVGWAAAVPWPLFPWIKGSSIPTWNLTVKEISTVNSTQSSD